MFSLPTNLIFYLFLFFALNEWLYLYNDNKDSENVIIFKLLLIYQP